MTKTRKEKPAFPDIVTSLPKADIPIAGLQPFILQGKTQQVLFMQFANDAMVPEHSHAAQWGLVVCGTIDLTIGGKKHTFRKGDNFFIPAGVPHKAKIYAGYVDVTLFDQKDRYKPLPARGTKAPRRTARPKA